MRIALDKLTIYSNIGVVVFGGLTVLFDNPTFIKIKLTAINLAFSASLFYMFFAKKTGFKVVFQGRVSLDDRFWLLVTRRFAFLFLGIAILNEIVWRSFPESTWVNFKVFMVPLIMMVFFVLQFKFIMKNGKIIEKSEKQI